MLPRLIHFAASEKYLFHSSLASLSVNSDLSSTNLILNGVTITGNVIESNDLNTDLILDPAGAINVVDTNLSAGVNLLISGSSNLSDVTITATVTHTNNLTRVGNADITGSTEIQGFLSVSGTAQYQNIRIEGNKVSSDTGIVLSAQLTRLVIFNDDLIIDQGLEIQGNLVSDDLTVRTQATGLSIFVDDILVQENFITTTLSNSDLELRANGTGRVNITDSFVVENDITISGTTTLLS